MRNRCISPHSWSRVPSRLVAGLLRLLADWPIPLTSWCKGHERPLALTLYRVALKAASGKSIYGHLGRKWPFISSQFLTSPHITPYIQDILAYTVYQQSSQLLCNITLPDEKEESAKSLSLNSTAEENSFSEGFDVRGNLLRFFWLNKGTERQPAQINSFRSGKPFTFKVLQEK